MQNLGSPLNTTGGGTSASTATGTGSNVLANSPALTGSPTAPTPAIGTSNTQLATCEFSMLANSIIASNPQSAAYTLALSDAGKVVEYTGASAANFTIPLNSVVPFPVGTVIEFYQYGAGQITLAGASGVTLRTPASLTSRAQYSTLAIRQRATNEWAVSGDLT